MANTPLIPHSGLGNSVYSGDAKGIMKVNPYEKLLWNNFASLIEQAVRYQDASCYSDLNEEMQWALGIAALRENKTWAMDADFGDMNELIADIIESKGSQESLHRLYEHLVRIMLHGNKLYDAHVAYCIDNALEKEEDKQAYYEAVEARGVK